MLKILTATSLGLTLLAGAATPIFAKDNSPAKYACMTDDGNGRYRPCSASFKAANKNWRGGDNCFTDEGNGRYRPCSASYKAKYQK